MSNWPKPAEGSWTEHYPELGTGPISFRDSTSPEFYELEREAVFKRAWLNVGRIEELPDVGQLPHQRDRSRRRLGHPRQRRATNESAPSTTSAATAVTSWCGTTFPTRRPAATCRRVHLQVPRVALRPRRCTDVRAAGFRVLRLRHGRLRAESGALRRLERLHLHQLRPRAAPGPARVPRADDHRASTTTRSTSSPNATTGSRTTTATGRSSPTRSRSTTTCPSLHAQQVPPEVRVPNAGFVCGHFQLDGPHRVVSTAGTAPLAAARGVHVPDRAGHPERARRTVAHPRYRSTSARASTPAASSRGGSATSRSSRTSRS